MLFYTHLLLGLFGALLVVNNVNSKILFLVFVLIGSIFPDIDSMNSKLGRKSLSKIVTAFTKHRGFFHSLTAALLIFVLLSFVSISIGWAFSFGYLIHLASDCFTKRGVRLFWPFGFKINGFVRSGGRLETGILIVFLLIDSWIIFKMFF